DIPPVASSMDPAPPRTWSRSRTGSRGRRVTAGGLVSCAGRRCRIPPCRSSGIGNRAVGLEDRELVLGFSSSVCEIQQSIFRLCTCVLVAFVSLDQSRPERSGDAVGGWGIPPITDEDRTTRPCEIEKIRPHNDSAAC